MIFDGRKLGQVGSQKLRLAPHLPTGVWSEDGADRS